ncbi:peptide MFS transporter [Thermoactinomyces mirandus]|uniref:Peptide MFS transporter n=1 Tax=Thermoactinomyces mirandus TaxID=2756294 RepID=A0A7W1XPG3_9BACL|nr:peptide MFS transporter [Thermoactinomyces mirandus]MBA4600809.1 peptide MFS transporter [Thermoactinomyces mirandus]
MDAAVKLEENLQETSSKKKHPPGLKLLFFTEMWERFSYYGMRGLLFLYLTVSFVSGGLGFSDATASMIYGFYTGAVYFAPLVGGWLTDRFIGKRLAITMGGITMAAGNFVLFAFQTHWGLYLGLSLLIIGNGFFKPNISTLLGDLYGENDPRRDSAFTIFYMGINFGALFAPIVCGFMAEDLFKTTINGIEHFGFRFGFLTASIGMIIGQIAFNLLGNRYLGDAGKKPNAKKTVENPKADAPLTKKEKQRTWAIIIITCFVVFFWAGFEQAGTSLTAYTRDFVDRNIFGWEMPISWFQAVNPFFIIMLAPLTSMLWTRLARSKRGDLPVPIKMGLGMILLGSGFIVLMLAVMQTGSDPDNIVIKANLLFIVFTYLLHTIGELFLSPIGLSLVSRIAPVKLASLLMGVWLASSGFANILAGQIAALTATLGYLEIFATIGGVAITIGLLLISINRILVRMMD